MSETENQMNILFIRIEELNGKLDSLLARNPTTQQTFVPQPQKQMFPAICADCKKECTVPFKPNPGGLIRCKECYTQKRGY